MAPPSHGRLRVALVTTTNQFIFEGNVISTRVGLRPLGANPRYETRATGGFLATLALIRYLQRHSQVTILAIETIDETLKNGTEVVVERWQEGADVHRGSTGALGKVTVDGGYDVAVCTLGDCLLYTSPSPRDS